MCVIQHITALGGILIRFTSEWTMIMLVFAIIVVLLYLNAGHHIFPWGHHIAVSEIELHQTISCHEINHSTIKMWHPR
ncbi:hypothetical protein BDB01DRAFT_421900 [Pilobolus umbonatus]|nr:hypothetical protein BDB01DRAFT_421900 [Pilobolus umbonatus]